MLKERQKNSFGEIASKINGSKIGLGVIALLFFGLIHVLNIYYPICLDDWDYSFVFREVPLRRIQSVSDIITSQYNHYYTWGGRSVVHFIAQLLLYIGNPTADILNSVAYILFAYLVYCICNRGQAINTRLFIVINIAMWFLYPDILVSVIWLTGSANYLWGTLLIFFFIYPYYCYYLDGKPQNNIIRFVLFFFLGIITGWTNENTALAMIAILVFFIVYWGFKKEKIPAWAISGLVGACIGYVIMIAAPGNYERMTQALLVSNQYHKSLIQLLPYRVYSIIANFWQILLLNYAIYGVLAYLYLKRNEKKVSSKIALISFVFFAAFNVSVWSMAVSPIFPVRAFFGPISYSIVASGILLANLKYSLEWGRRFGYVFLLAGCLLFAYSYTSRVKGVYLLYTLMQERYDFINQEKSRGVKDIVVTKQISIPSVFSVYADVSADPENWTNTSYKAYFGINSIVYKPNTNEK